MVCHEYTIYEQTLIAVYDAEVLDPELTQQLLSIYATLDHSGCLGVRARDGLTADEIVVKMLAPEFYWGPWAEECLTLTKIYGPDYAQHPEQMTSTDRQRWVTLVERLQAQWARVVDNLGERAMISA